jgi:hypothetical protein
LRLCATHAAQRAGREVVNSITAISEFRAPFIEIITRKFANSTSDTETHGGIDSTAELTVACCFRNTSRGPTHRTA